VSAAGDQYCEWRHGPDGEANVRSLGRKRTAGFVRHVPAGARQALRRATAHNSGFRSVLANAVTTGRDKPVGNAAAERRAIVAARGRALRTVPAQRVGPLVSASFGLALLLGTIAWIGAARVRTRTRQN
jgi:hypothetical protein